MGNPFQAIYDEINGSNCESCPFPLLVDIEVTSRCNLRCLMCLHTYMRRKQEDMSREVWDSIIEQCRPHRPGIRLIMYSEPFLVGDILDKCRDVKLAGMPLHITTNGTVLKKEQIDALVDMGLDSIIFSFQGATPEEYSIIRSTDRYEKVRENIKYLYNRRKTGPYIQITSTVTERDKEEDIAVFKKYWSQYSDKVTVGATSLHHVVLRRPDIYEYLGIVPLCSTEHMPCQDIFYRVFIQSSGNMVACSQDADGIMTMGNVLDGGMQSVWQSETYQALRVLLKNMKMDMLDLCKRCFPAYNFKKHG